MPPRSPSRLGRLAVALALALLPLALLYRPLLRGEAFVPADLLGYVAPFKSAAGSDNASGQDRPAWNVLRYDGITQFYPWRLQAARAVRAGHVPLWNPYQFGFAGGTPLLANSQSAPLYPPNVLFYLFGPERAGAAFGWSAALHLLVAAAGMYRLLRSRGGPFALGRIPALTGAWAWALSSPVVTWLALPTFLAVSCWLPWLLLLVYYAHALAGTRPGRFATLGAGAVAGTLLLAGHLQITFYCLLAAGSYAAWLGAQAWHARRITPLRWLATLALVSVLALCLAAPQLLPSVELGRASHRSLAKASAGGYFAYSDTAVPPRNLLTLIAPNFFGHPNDGTYWNRIGNLRSPVNYAEVTLYAGVVTVLLAAYALALPWRRRGQREYGSLADRPFFAGLGLLALLMALGTPVNRLFYFGVPGFAQTGSPGRALLLVAFALAVLGAMGLDALLRPESALEETTSPQQRRRAGWAAVAGPTLLAAGAASLAAQFVGSVYPAGQWGPLVALALPGLLAAFVLFALGALVLWEMIRERRKPAERVLLAGLCLALVAGDLLRWGAGYNPSVRPAAVFPLTPGLRWLRQNAPNALIAPLNRSWSLGPPPPQQATLPPNALTVYGLHDVAGYDSLFPGAYKRRVTEAGDGEDPSPLENGNIVFVKRAATAVRLGARYLVTAPEAPPLLPPFRPVYAGPDLTIYENPGGRDFAGVPAGGATRPAAFRIGLFAGLCASGLLAGAGTFVAAAQRARRRRV